MTYAYNLAFELSYRIGWCFHADPNVSDLIWITWTSPNSVNPAETIALRVSVPVTGDLDADLAAVERRIEGVEAHERAEWFRYKEECVSPEARRAHPGMFHPRESADGA